MRVLLDRRAWRAWSTPSRGRSARSPEVDALYAAPGEPTPSPSSRPVVEGVDVADDGGGCGRSAQGAEGSTSSSSGPRTRSPRGSPTRSLPSGVACFGPSAAAAQLEASKSFAKEFMRAPRRSRRPPSPSSTDVEAARAYVRRLGGPCVVKANGLAAGKGVAVCDGPEEALAALDEMMGDRGASARRAIAWSSKSGCSARRPRTTR